MTAVSAVHAQVAPATPVALFSDPGNNIWGLLAGGATPSLAVARCNGEQPVVSPVQLDLGDGSTWIVTGSGCSLQLEVAEVTSATTADAGAIQPGRAVGSLTLHGVAHELAATSVRSDRLGDPEGGGPRLFASWFPAGQELALLSLRPHGATGHDHDRIDVVARGEERPLVVDPRLSTTYDRAGNPLRVGVEFWLGEDDGAEDGLLPRRVAGRATGALTAAAGLEAYAFSCVSRGEPGIGVYLLGGHTAG